MDKRGESTTGDDKEKNRPGFLKRVDRHIQSRILAGLLGLLPLLALVVVILFFVGHADSLIRPLYFVSDRPWDVKGIG